MEIFFLVTRSFEIYSLSHFQIRVTVLSILVTTLCVTAPGLIYFITGGLSLATPFACLGRGVAPVPGGAL